MSCIEYFVNRKAWDKCNTLYNYSPGYVLARAFPNKSLMLQIQEFHEKLPFLNQGFEKLVIIITIILYIKWHGTR